MKPVTGYSSMSLLQLLAPEDVPFNMPAPTLFDPSKSSAFVPGVKQEIFDRVPVSPLGTEERRPKRVRTSLPFDSPQTQMLTVETVEDLVHLVDWKYLKLHYDFNTTIRQSKYYIAKGVSRREKAQKVDDTTPEVISRKHCSKTKCLTSHNVQHLKFLLTIDAFTLNTPGFCEISETDLVQLFEIYFYKLNSVFPIVFEAEFWELYKRNRIPNIVMYAVVLNAARDELSTPILARSFTNGRAFKDNHARFLNELEMKIRQLLMFLPELGDTEKLARLITQLLLSLCFKFNKFGNEQSSSDIGNCVSLGFSLLIHQRFFHNRIAKEGATKKSEYLKRLWWILFAFDRMNALFNGKGMYIKRLDFNILRPTDMPHLDKIVELAYSLEDTIIAVFRPTRIVAGKEIVSPLDTLDGDPVFRPSELIEKELKVLEDVAAMRQKFTEYKQYETTSTGHIPGIPVEKYRDRIVYFLERLIHHQIILILRTGQIKYSENFPHLDEFSLGLVEKLLLAFEFLKDGRGHQLINAAPIIPLIILAAFSVPMTARLRIMAKLNEPNEPKEDKQLRKVTRIVYAYLDELRLFADKWWFVDEVVTSMQKFIGRNERKSDAATRKEKTRMDQVTNAEDAEQVLPALLSITSPGFYDGVLEDDTSEEEAEKILECELLTPGVVNTRTLVPPAMEFNPPMYFSADDLALRTFEARTMASAVDVQSRPAISSRDSLSSSEDVVFDVAQLAELVTNETSFVPSVMDFFNEQNYDMTYWA